MGILETIDGALEDWETSDDAMRWVPKETRPTTPRLPRISEDGSYPWHRLGASPSFTLPDEATARASTPHLDEAVRQLAHQASRRTVHVDLSHFRDQMDRIMREVGEAAQRAVIPLRAFVEITAQVEEEQARIIRRAALENRRRRNTGPASAKLPATWRRAR